MKKILKPLALLLILTFTVALFPTTAVMAEEKPPVIAFVGIDHSPLIVGDTETFTITTANAEKVQYKIMLKTLATGKWENLTNDYTEEVAANIPYAITPSKTFEKGKYTLRVYARRTSDGAEGTYDCAVNCVDRDDANRIYANDSVDVEKTTYQVGEKIVIKGLKSIGGIKGPYKYRLHIYNTAKDTWTKNVTDYGDTIEWTPTETGTYVFDIYINSLNSTTWANYTKNPNSTNSYGTYEAWKLLVVTVTNAESDNERAIKEVIKAENKAMNDGDVNEFMALYEINDGDFEEIDEETKQELEDAKNLMKEFFETFKIEREINEMQVLSTKESDAQVMVTTTTKATILSGEKAGTSKKYKEKELVHLQKICGKWIIVDSEEKSMEYLD